MKLTTLFLLTLLTVIISSCGQAKKVDAENYYSSYFDTILPYQSGVETMLKELKIIVEKGIKTTDGLKQETTDSLKIINSFLEFEKLTANTKSKISSLNDFNEFDLKKPALTFVEKSSKVISSIYKEVVFPLQDSKSKISKEELASLTEKFMNQLIDANREFVESQVKFVNKFNIKN